MKVNLFVSYYKDKSEERQKEIDFCLVKNIKADFDSIQVLIHTKDLPLVPIAENLQYHVGFERPTFNDFFKIMSLPEFKDDINILSNTDIFFEDLAAIKRMYEIYGRKTCLALSRWDYFPDGTSIHFERADSQDTWIFLGTPEIRTSIEFSLGKGGCDNRLAYELQQNGYNVINPSKTIKTYHYHNSNIRYWIEDEYRVPQPYLLLNPTL